MKLAEGGEAFFVIETTETIAPGYQTSPLVSPAASPKPHATEGTPTIELAEPEPLDLATHTRRQSVYLDNEVLGHRLRTPVSIAPRPASGDWSGRPMDMYRSATDDILPTVRESFAHRFDKAQSQPAEDHGSASGSDSNRSSSPPPLSKAEAMTRAIKPLQESCSPPRSPRKYPSLVI